MIDFLHFTQLFSLCFFLDYGVWGLFKNALLGYMHEVSESVPAYNFLSSQPTTLKQTQTE
jgi:hypothetical protein